MDRYRAAYVGVDIGQVVDFAAFCIVEMVEEPTGEFYCHDPDHTWKEDHGAGGSCHPRFDSMRLVRNLYRLPLQTSYLDIAHQVRRVVDALNKRDPDRPTFALVDAGGARPIVEMVGEALRGADCHLTGVTITSGEDYDGYAGLSWDRVPKRHLVDNALTVFEQGRVKMRRKFKNLLLPELLAFRREITASRNEVFGAVPGKHDDLVIAFSLAVLHAAPPRAYSYDSGWV